jgi:hypothetical protein
VRVLADVSLPFCGMSRPLRRIYFLGSDPVQFATIRPLSAADSLIQSLRHSFLLDLQERALLTWHFGRLSSLATKRMHYWLDFPRRFEDLTSVQAAILQHANDASFPNDMQTQT